MNRPNKKSKLGAKIAAAVDKADKNTRKSTAQKKDKTTKKNDTAKIGRPEKGKDKLTKRVSVVLTEAEQKSLAKAAQEYYPVEMSTNSFVRAILKEAGIFEKY